MQLTYRYLQIDEEGFLVMNGIRVTDADFGASALRSLRCDERGVHWTVVAGESVVVEAFDAPLVVRSIRREGGRIIAVMAYSYEEFLDLSTLSVDEWDRFHAQSATGGAAMVFSRAAQALFFDTVDSFDDDSITFDGCVMPIPPWLTPFPESRSHDFWSTRFLEPGPRWDLGCETPILPSVLPQLKRPRSNVLVLGCGSGHDAAYLARQGHLVTAVDFSDEGLIRARSRYAGISSLTFHKLDAFNLPSDFRNRFDLIFEHTFYCAIPPASRNELVKVWLKCLVPGGHLLAVFFVMEKRTGPPWGGSEWEVRHRLSSRFDFQYWTRWHHSHPDRLHRELVVYAQKKEGSTG